jgi:hypothetical protein
MLGTVARIRVPGLGVMRTERTPTVAVTRQWYLSNATLMTVAVLLFVVEVYANVAMRGAARLVVIGVCAGAMLACVWRMTVNNRSGNR